MNQYPQVINESLCFVCQINRPTKIVTRDGETFNLCTVCSIIVEEENIKHNRLKQELAKSRLGRIFEQVLGGRDSLFPTEIHIRDIE